MLASSLRRAGSAWDRASVPLASTMTLLVPWTPIFRLNFVRYLPLNKLHSILCAGPLQWRKPCSTLKALKPRPPAKIICMASNKSLEFVVEDCHVEFGQELRVVGGDSALGAWDTTKAVPLRWTEGDTWVGTTELASETEETQVDFKFIKMCGGELVAWEDGDDRSVAVADGRLVKVLCRWSEPNMATEDSVTSAAGSEQKKVDRLQSKRKNLTEKVRNLEAKVRLNGNKMKRMKETVESDAEASGGMYSVTHAFEELWEEVQKPEIADAPVAADHPNGVEPAMDHNEHVSQEVVPPSEMASLVTSASFSPDGTLTVKFAADVGDTDSTPLVEKLEAKSE